MSQRAPSGQKKVRLRNDWGAARNGNQADSFAHVLAIFGIPNDATGTAMSAGSISSVMLFNPYTGSASGGTGVGFTFGNPAGLYRTAQHRWL